jgi:hypothetical protein
MKTNNKNVISMLMVACLLLCISMFGILILTMNVIDSKVAPINQVEFEEEKVLEKEDIKWDVSFDYEKISHYLLSDEMLEENFYLDNIPAEYGDAFLYYTKDRKEMRPYFFSLMMHESNGFTAFKHKNKDGSYDYGPSQLNSNNIKNEKFRNWYNPKDESHITNKYCFYMVMSMNFYWDLVNKYGYDYAFYAYNGGERTVKLIKNKSSHNASLVKAVKTYDIAVRKQMQLAEINLENYVVQKRAEHINELQYKIANSIHNIHLAALERADKNESNNTILQDTNEFGNYNIFYIRREDLLQFEIKEGVVIGKTIIGTFNI